MTMVPPLCEDSAAGGAEETPGNASSLYQLTIRASSAAASLP